MPPKNNVIFTVAIVILLLTIFITYANHFNNSFHFDDGHTIVTNPYIKSFSNTWLFFTDGRTFSTRITSYNVCYTKLLRVLADVRHLGAVLAQQQARRVRQAGRLDLRDQAGVVRVDLLDQLLEWERVDLVEQGDDAVLYGLQPRITSYNVCYTKLLRGSFRTAPSEPRFQDTRASRLRGWLWILQVTFWPP